MTEPCGSDTLVHIKDETFKCYKCKKIVDIPRIEHSEKEYRDILKKSFRNRRFKK